MMHSKFLILLISVLSIGLAGCDMTANTLKMDREGELEAQDYRDAFASRLPDADDNKSSFGASALELQPYIANTSQDIETFPLVSVSVNQSVPLKDILYELAEQANYDLELDPRITGSIIFTARERPFNEVVERIADVAGLRHSFKNQVLRVELDSEYHKVYKIDYLSYIRSNSGSISNNISVVSGDGADSGSNFEANSSSESDFWGELEVNLAQMITGAQTSSLRTRNDPRIVAEDINPDVQAVAPFDENGNFQVQPPEAVLRVDSLPIDVTDQSFGQGDSQAQGQGDSESLSSFAINRQAGLINIFAPEKTHKEVGAYLTLLKRSVTSQVLIEAKILEVSLTDEHATGINWSAIGLPGDLDLNFVSAAGGALLNSLGDGIRFPQGDVATPDAQAITASINGNDIQALIGAVSQFGTVRALASPRLTVLNNQSAVLNVATNRVFFEIEIETTPVDGSTPLVNVDSDIRNVPDGVLVNVQPSIDLENRTISMAVRPTVTSIGPTKNDPGVAFAAAQCGADCANITSPVPELNVQEIDSVIKVNSGQAIVMGGLLQDRVEGRDSGTPILGEAPVIGRLFKDHNDDVVKTELVIFLKATILNDPTDSVHNADKDLYRKFSSDRRPLRF